MKSYANIIQGEDLVQSQTGRGTYYIQPCCYGFKVNKDENVYEL